MGPVFSNQIQNKKIEDNMPKKLQSKIREKPEYLNFIFPEDENDTNNGHCLNEIFLPEEVLILIFSYIPISDILKIKLVCKKWYNLMKTHALWATIYSRKQKRIPKLLPWYILYASLEYDNVNLLKNNCGQNKFSNWTILVNGGDKFKVEEIPIGSDSLPIDCPDFSGSKSCFATSYGLGHKIQDIPLTRNLINYIVNKHKPHIYISEWVAGRFDCGGSYTLEALLYSPDFIIKEGLNNYSDTDSEEEEFHHHSNRKQLKGKGILIKNTAEEYKYSGGEATKWKKIDLLLKDYPDGVKGIIFSHKARDNQFWAGHYGPKMAGGVVKVLFDSIGLTQQGEESN